MLEQFTLEDGQYLDQHYTWLVSVPQLCESGLFSMREYTLLFKLQDWVCHKREFLNAPEENLENPGTWTTGTDESLQVALKSR